MKIRKFALILVAVMAASVLFSCTSPKEKKEKNVVTDLTPVHRWDRNTLDMLDSLKTVPDAEKARFINRRAPHLVPTMIAQIEQKTGKFHLDSLIWHFGSGKAKGVLDSAGTRSDGVYEDELTAKIWTTPVTKFGQPIKVFVRCLNGMIEIEGDVRIGAAPLEFTIQKTEGLCSHLDYNTSIWLSDRFDLPLFKGNKFRKVDRITATQAKQLKNKLYKGQISVLVFEGDKFVLGGPGIEPRYIKAKR